MEHCVFALTLRHLTAHYPSAPAAALHDCSFDLRKGEHVGLLGLNGSGKTTLLMAIAGLVASTGEIRVEGVHLTPSTLRGVRSRIGFLFSTPEDQILFPRVLDDVAYGPLTRGVKRDIAYEEARLTLQELGAESLEQKEPYELSHGQRLRVAIAGVLVNRPPLLLLDEPTAALDPPGRRAVARLLHTTPSAFLLATHDLDTAARCCSRFILLEEGRLTADVSSLDHIRPSIERDGPH